MEPNYTKLLNSLEKSGSTLGSFWFLCSTPFLSYPQVIHKVILSGVRHILENL